MKFTWSVPTKNTTTNAYLDWFDHVYQPGTSGAYGYELQLVKVKPSGRPASIEKTLIWLENEVSSATDQSDFIMDSVERARLTNLIADPEIDRHAPDIFIFRKISEHALDAKHGKKLKPLPFGAQRPYLPRPAKPVMVQTPQPIVAVIDDAIGFLNARFTIGDGDTRKTRLHNVWLQAEPELTEIDNACAMTSGKQISSSEINDLLALGTVLDEGAHYAAVNEELYGHQISPIWHGITAGAGSELASTHGTHVADIAGGADPVANTDPLLDCPMLAVQLPPQAVEDTSGSKLQPYVVRALQWIISKSDALTVDGVHRPLIVNISLGVLAGSKDGTSLIERQVAAEVLRREARTAMPMRVVFAFGNDNLTRQIGYMSLDAKNPQDVTLRVQSEDYTPSFVEFRPDRPQDLELQIDCLLSEPFALKSIPAGKSVSLSRGQGPSVARVYAIPVQKLDGGGTTSAYYVLAIAPTATFESGKPIAPSGAWQIGLRTKGATQTVRIAVQRDDRPLGFQALARQAYLDDHALWEWKPPEKTAYTPPADGPVTALGSHSAWLSADMPEQIYSVGAALGDTGFAAPYSATGAPYTRPEPSMSAIGDSSWTLRGVMASGTLSGTTTVLSGTSVAAPQITRELAMLFAGGPDIGPWNPPEINAVVEFTALSELDWSFIPAYQIDQLGPLNVSREAGLRLRLDEGFSAG